jgi:hypothetical protein
MRLTLATSALLALPAFSSSAGVLKNKDKSHRTLQGVEGGIAECERCDPFDDQCSGSCVQVSNSVVVGEGYCMDEGNDLMTFECFKTTCAECDPGFEITKRQCLGTCVSVSTMSGDDLVEVGICEDEGAEDFAAVNCLEASDAAAGLSVGTVLAFATVAVGYLMA